MPEQPERKITFVFEKADGKKTIPVTGAIGGPSPDGRTVIAHLYAEYASVPNMITHDVGEGGRIDLKKEDRVSRGDATREVQATLVMSPENALSLAQWMLQHAEKALQRRDGNAGQGGEPANR